MLYLWFLLYVCWCAAVCLIAIRNITSVSPQLLLNIKKRCIKTFWWTLYLGVRSWNRNVAKKKKGNDVYQSHDVLRRWWANVFLVFTPLFNYSLEANRKCYVLVPTEAEDTRETESGGQRSGHMYWICGSHGANQLHVNNQMSEHSLIFLLQRGVYATCARIVCVLNCEKNSAEGNLWRMSWTKRVLFESGQLNGSSMPPKSLQVSQGHVKKDEFKEVQPYENVISDCDSAAQRLVCGSGGDYTV